jgi:uncharacterized alpha/beta hydrolase family protein
MDEKIKYILKFFIFVLLVFAIINILACINLNAEESQPKMPDIALIEGLEQPIATGPRAFCDTYRGSSNSLNVACRKLTEKNCNETSCCVFSNKKCVAGAANGPTYKNGNSSNLTYYFQNKCYGANCPSA